MNTDNFHKITDTNPLSKDYQMERQMIFFSEIYMEHLHHRSYEILSTYD